jgi:hypothetical protein
MRQLRHKPEPDQRRLVTEPGAGYRLLGES